MVSTLQRCVIHTGCTLKQTFPAGFLKSLAHNLFGRDGEENVRDSGDETIILDDNLNFESDDELSDSNDESWSEDSDCDAEAEEEHKD